MKDFTLALVAQESPVLKRALNLEQTVAWCRKAAKEGADLVLFPELNVSGHVGHPVMVECAEPVPAGPAAQTLSRTAKELNLHICAGVAESEYGIHYNTQFMVGPDGYLGKQRKTHLSHDEYFHFRHGTRLPVFTLPFARVGVVICYDNLFPEIARSLAINGAEVILSPHAARFGKWPSDATDRRKRLERALDQWELTHRSRAYDNGVYVALCNTAGRSAMGVRGVEANHAGGCMVIDPKGDVLCRSKQNDIREEMRVVRLSAEAVARRRNAPCFNLQTRRPELFDALTRPTE